MKPRLVSKLLTVTMVFALMLAVNLVAANAAEVSVSDENKLKQAIITAKDVPTTILMTANIELTASFNVPKEADIILKSADGTAYKLIAARNAPTIMIAEGGALTVEDIIITHIDGTASDGVSNRGSFTFNSGAIDNNEGYGVYNSGVFIMNGGTITTNDNSGVYINNDGNFTLNNGEIINNKSNGVYNFNGTFTMNGGKISGNSIDTRGGGVYNNGVFTMKGGEITDNTAGESGGGVYNNSEFTINGGWIYYNKARNEGDVHEGTTFFNKISSSSSGSIGSPRYPAAQQQQPEPIPVDAGISVVLNGTTLVFDQPPVIENGRTLVPLRAIFEALGATVEWDPTTQTVTAKKDDITVTLVIGRDQLVKNGKSIQLDVAAKIVGGRTMVPARAVAESFGAKVDWDESTKSVIITN